jgi:molybdate transport system substrate-binding protein
MRAILLVLALCGCVERHASSIVEAPTPAAPSEVRVFAAASLTEPLTEIAEAYQRETGRTIVFNFGGSSLLARQIAGGAPADLFLSADEAQMRAVTVVERASVLSNALVVVVPREDLRPVADVRALTEPRFERIALAEPSRVPAGVYARECLTERGVWPAVAPKVVPTENVRGALAAVAAGNASAAIVYRTDARVSNRVRVACEIAGGPPISYPFALLTHSVAAREFYDHLRSKPALDAFRRHGFDVLR